VVTAGKIEGDFFAQLRPRFAVYWVSPSVRESMAAFRICQGVLKSGSPTPREIVSCIPAARSKKRRMPLGGTEAMR
jgi:hypothetical protein